jgi:hypothetical protein
MYRYSIDIIISIELIIIKKYIINIYQPYFNNIINDKG